MLHRRDKRIFFPNPDKKLSLQIQNDKVNKKRVILILNKELSLLLLQCSFMLLNYKARRAQLYRNITH